MTIKDLFLMGDFTQCPPKGHFQKVTENINDNCIDLDGTWYLHVPKYNPVIYSSMIEVTYLKE